MSNIVKLVGRLAQDEGGGEVIEYALVLGLISIVAITLIASFGTKVVARWATVNSSL